ncbi:MAG: FtsK/SpoIIIE domain-containing protein [Acidimicrobiales bacterium]
MTELLLEIKDATGETWAAAASVPGGADEAVDVRVQACPDHTVRRLTVALCKHLGIAATSSITLQRSGSRHRRAPTPCRTRQRFDPSSRLGDIGLRSGDRLVIATGGGPHAGRRSPVVLEADGAGPRLVVSSGPDVGRMVGIGSGVTVGRDSSCDLQLTDPTVGRQALRVEPAVPNPAGHGQTSVACVRPLSGSPVSVDGAAVTGESTNNGPVAVEEIPVAEGELIRVGSTTLRAEPSCTAVKADAAAASTGDVDAGEDAGEDSLGEVAVHRVPRRSVLLEPVVFAPLGDLPDRPEPPRFGFLVAMAPVLVGITLAVVYSPRMLLFAAFAPVMAGAAYFEARRRNKARFNQAVDRTLDRLAVRRAEIEAAKTNERRARFALAPDLAQLHAEAVSRPPQVWPRDLSANDVLSVRVGLGRVYSLVETEPETRGDQDLRSAVADVIAEHEHLVDVPVTVDLASESVVSIVGEPPDRGELMASMVVQAAHLFSPRDLTIAAVLSPGHPASQWLGWLPHCRAATSPVRGSHIGVGIHAERLLRSLVAVAEHRVTDDRAAGNVDGPRLLVVIDAALRLDPPLIAGLLNAASASRISVLWVGGDSDRVPWQTARTILCRRLIDDRPSILTSPEPATTDQPIEIDRLTPARARRLARTLAPFRDAQVDDRSGGLPRVASLGEALSADRIDERWVGDRWKRARRRSLPVPIGMTATGPFVIDLVEHGPHGLIGGTSGSGKSELLTSLVASLIACHPPTHVTVLFVDYKGGSSSDPFVEAPHTVGCVTNLDPFLARRALSSLRAELNRRMALLAGRAKDLAELVDRYPTEAPPALVIVVDELAALVQDVPDFVAGLVDIAQRGRSLGIHLLLATQRPAGVVNDNILANTNLRIALRMLDGAESSGLIGTNVAASIPTAARGRAFARLSPGAPIAFQSAWSGTPSAERKLAEHEIEVRPLLDGDPDPDRDPDRNVEWPRDPSQGPDHRRIELDTLLAAVTGAATVHDRTFRPRRPWHDELPAELSLEAVWESAAEERSTRGDVVLGLLDVPEQQWQGPAIVDLASGGLAVFGTGGSGKSTALRTLASSAALDDGLEGGGNLLIFGLDFGARDLAPVAGLPQCGEVAAGDDLEAVTRIVSLLDRVVQDRRSAKGRPVASNPAEDGATILLLIDDYGNLATTFEGAGASAELYAWFETLNRVIVDGRQLGIRTALSASRRAVVKAGVLSAMTNRIVLRQADASSFVEFGLPGTLHHIDLGPGRGLLTSTTQIQIARSDLPTDHPANRPPALEVEAHSALHTHPLPLELRLDTIAATDTRGEVHLPERGGRTGARSGRRSVVLGVADLAGSGEVVTVDLDANDLAIVGEPMSGRSTALHTIGKQLVAAGAEVLAIGPPGSPLGRLSDLRRRAFTVQAIAELLGELADAQTPDADRGPILLVDDLDVLDRPQLERSFGQFCALGLRWVASTTTLRAYSTNPLVQELRRARSLLWLRPETPREIQEMTGVVPVIRPGLPMPPGRGVLVVNRRATVLQIAR